jgi:hypothetical protein
MATKAKVTCRQSTMGRKPEPAAPIAMPVSAPSAIGVALTRWSPNSLTSAGIESVDM